MQYTRIFRYFIGVLITVAVGYSAYRLWDIISDRLGKKDAIDITYMHQHEHIVPVAIVGSGPAGYAAALYAARGTFHTVVFEGDLPGGQLMTTSWVENWPAISKKLGPEIMRDARQQATSFGAHISSQAIVQVDTKEWPYTLTTQDGQTIKALTVIWATGATPKTLGVPGEQLYWGSGVTTCAVCDAPFYKNARVCVVGGGDSAVEEAIELAPYAREVVMMVRSNKMRATPVMKQHLQAHHNITVWYNTQICEIHGDDEHVTSVTIDRDGQQEVASISGVFLAIGHQPNTQLLRDVVDSDQHGYIQVYGRSQRTSLPGVFAAGDVEDPVYKQAGVAAGSGIKAALDAADFLRSIGYTEHVAQAVSSHLYEPERDTYRVPLSQITSYQELQDHVLQARGLVLLDVYTESCPSCLRMMPDIEYIAGKFADDVSCYKVNALSAQDVIQGAEITGVPVPRILLYRDGKQIYATDKILSRQELTQLIQTYAQ